MLPGIVEIMKTQFVSLAVASLALTASAWSAIIYQDDFSGAAGPLNSTAPDVRPGTETWTAHAAFTLTGSSAANVAAENSARGAYLPFVPQTGFLYDLRVTVKFAAELAQTRSLQMGFLEFAPTGSTGRVVATGDGAAAFFLRNNGSYQARFEGGTAPAATMPEGSISPTTVDEPHTMRLTLDTSGASWVLHAYFDGAEVGTGFTYTTNPTGILAVGISSNTSNSGGATGDFTNFIFTAEAIPEPSAALLLFASIGSVIIRRRRR